MLMKKRKAPGCMTPRRNCTLTESPFASGTFAVMTPTRIEVFQPPPLTCVGGCSTVVPRTVTGLPPTMTEMSCESRARRSAVPASGGEKVVTSTMRKRSADTGAPTSARARALTGAGVLAHYQSDQGRAVTLCGACDERVSPRQITARSRD